MDLAGPDELQTDLFAPPTIGSDALMATLDRINRRFGRGTAGLGAPGWQEKPDWGMRQLNLLAVVHDMLERLASRTVLITTRKAGK